MIKLRYALERLRTDYFMSGVTARYRRGRPVPPPRYVLWDATRRCNLSCAHCGATDETYARELTTEEVTELVDHLAELGGDTFAVTGGEPLLRKDLLDVLAHARARGLRTGIATNGFLVDRTMAERIRAAGVHSVQVSLDGLEATHNEIRRHRQSFARALDAIGFLLEQSIPLVTVATTVTPRNLPDMEGLYELLRALGAPAWRLVAVMPIGRAQATGLALTGPQLVSLLEFVARNRRREMPIYVSDNLPFLAAWEKRVRSTPLVCPVGFMACCVGVDGHVRGCPEQPDTPAYREGSVLEQSLGQIWQTGFGRYRERVIRSTDARCAACPAWHSCYGGCWVMREGDAHCIVRWIGE